MACGLHVSEDCKRATTERYPMFPFAFHARAGDSPSLVVPIDLFPLSADALSGSSRRQDCKFKRAGSDALLVAQRNQEARQLSVGQGGVVLDFAYLRPGRK